MKKLLILTGLFTLLFVSVSLAEMPIDVEVNSQRLAFDTAPYIHNGAVYVPLRTASEALGMDCAWNEGEKSARVSSDSTMMIFHPDSDSVYSNGERLRLEIHLADGRIHVPVRFLSERLGVSVSWDPLYYRVILDSEKDVPSHLLDKPIIRTRFIGCPKSFIPRPAVKALPGKLP